MATPATVNPFNFYPGRDGLPLQNGYLYFGEPFQDPELQPLQAYWDDANTQPAARPIRTINGYPARNGAPAQVFVGAQYSMRVRDSQGREVFYAPNVTAVDLGGGGLDIITASGGQTVVTLTNAIYTPGANAIDVSLNGLILISGQDYFETGTDRITMASALSAGDQIRAFARSTFGLTQAVLSDWQAEVFNGAGGGSQNFALLRNPGSVANMDISVTIGGIGSTLRPLIEYTLSGQTVTITPAPAVGTNNVLIRYGRSLPQDALRGELADPTSASNGSAMVAHYGPFAIAYLKTLSDIANGLPVNVLLCLPTAQRAGIRAYTSTFDCVSDVGSLMTDALAAKRAWLHWPEGLYNFGSLLTTTNKYFKWTGYGRRSFGSGVSNWSGTILNAQGNTGILAIAPGVLTATDILIECMGFYGTGAGANIDGVSFTNCAGMTLRDVVAANFSRNNITALGGAAGAYGLKLQDVYSATAGVANINIDVQFSECVNTKTDGGQYGLLGGADSAGLDLNGAWHFEGATVAGASLSGVRSTVSGGRVIGNTAATKGVVLAGAGSTMTGSQIYCPVGSGATSGIGIDVTGAEVCISGVRSVADTALRASGGLCNLSGVFEGTLAGVELVTNSGNGDSILQGFAASGTTHSVKHTSGSREWRIGPGMMMDAAAPGTFKPMTVTAGVPLIEGMNPKPICNISNSAAQSVANAAYTALNFDTEEVDNYALHSTSSNTSRITILYSARYRVSYSLQFAANATGIRTGRIRRDGATLLWNAESVPTAGAGVDTTVQGSFVVKLDATQYIELEAYQDSGGALNMQGGNGTSLTVVLEADS